MRKFVAFAAIAAVAWAAPAGAQEAKLKAVSFLPLSQSFGIHFKRWVDEVNSRGKGVLQIDAVGPEAIPVLEQPNAVKNGVVQMHYGPPTFYTGTMWEGEALSLSETTIKTLRANGAWAYLDKLHREKMNSMLLAGLGDGVQFFVYTTTPAKADDKDKPFTGMTLRSVPLYRVFFETLGARTVSLPPGEVFTALERKVVQGLRLAALGHRDSALAAGHEVPLRAWLLQRQRQRARECRRVEQADRSAEEAAQRHGALARRRVAR